MTLQLKRVARARFGGYEVAIKPGGPDISPEPVLAAGGADAVIGGMSLLSERRRETTPSSRGKRLS